MKALARCYVWWPRIDTDIQVHVAGCMSCQETRHAPPRAPVHPWEVTTVPWSRLHLDFAGPFQGHKFLIVVDSFSKYTEVREMSTTTATATIDVLRDMFATHGIPDVVVSDNGPPFQSKDYGDFLRGNVVRRVLIAPRRPAGNGQAERVVQSTKDSLRRIVKGTWKKRLAQFLLHQHITPSTVTGHSPGELLMGRRLRSCLDRLHPDFLKDQRERQELAFDKTSDRPLRQFELDDPVMVRNFSQGPVWVPAVVTKQTGPVSYRVATASGEIVRRHVDQMIKHTPPATSPQPLVTPQASEAVSPTVVQEEPLEVPQDQPPVPTTPEIPCVPSESAVSQPAPDPSLARPRRVIRKPGRYRDFVPH
ncbi:hypothetical protein RF55_17547 [Lasius niger]|uniref:RNA-directed DNA polymerase n=1 Tax=Lasius niger TaxID=67767 RepID=A0A0J7K2C1_LASNI|nr:hypothetical protein RF55_17547 [Lasius niger]